MKTALELLDMGIALRAERFRRENPTASEAEVDACVGAWLIDRPGAPHGDAPGRPRPLTGHS